MRGNSSNINNTSSLINRRTRGGYQHKKPKSRITKEVNDLGIIEFCNNKGELHNHNDKPAVIFPNGTQEWYQNGKRHRDNDQPAYIAPNKTEHWYQNGQLHRENDRPAVIHIDGTKRWYKNGQLHREGNKPAVIYPDGSEEYWQNNKQFKIE